MNKTQEVIRRQAHEYALMMLREFETIPTARNAFLAVHLALHALHVGDTEQGPNVRMQAVRHATLDVRKQALAIAPRGTPDNETLTLTINANVLLDVIQAAEAHIRTKGECGALSYLDEPSVFMICDALRDVISEFRNKR